MSFTCHAYNLNYQVSKQYTKKNGLPVNAVGDLAIDKTGFLWIVTHDGLIRFDGLNFKLFNTNTYPEMPTDRVLRIEALDNGNLMVTFDLNHVYILENETFIKIDTAFPFARHLLGDTFWFGNEKGLFKYNLSKKSTEHIIVTNKLKSFTLNDKGVYFVSTDCGLYFYSYHEKYNKMIEQLDCQAAFEMKISTSGTLAVATDDGVFILSNGIQHHLQGKHTRRLMWSEDDLYTISDKLYRISQENTVEQVENIHELNQIIDLYIQSSSNVDVWLNTFKQLLINDELVFESPSTISKYVVDGQGGLWVGTRSDGLFYLNKPKLSTFGMRENELFSGNVTSISLSKSGELLVGENAGLYSFNSQNESWKKFENIHKSRVFLADSQSNLWVGNDGLCLMTDGVHCEAQSNIVDDFSDLHLAYEQANGDIWISSYKGLFVKHNQKWQEIEGARGKYVFALEIPGRGVFVTSSDHGIDIFQDQQLVGQINLANGLPSYKIRAIYDASRIVDDSILIGTEDKGLCLWHLDRGLIRCASVNEGLMHHGIHRILPDQKERLWFSSNKGIYAVHIEELIKYFNFDSDYLPNYRFDEEDGMMDSEANGGSQSAGVVDNNGVMWFPTQKGIVKVDTNNIVTKPFPLTAHIKAVYVGNIKQESHHKIIVENNEQRNIKIALFTVALGQSDGIRYRYRLDQSEQWIELGNSTEIVFNAFPLGERTLAFQATRYGNWKGPITTLPIYVKPKLLETLWFRISFLLVVLTSLLLWIVRLRKRKFILEKQVGKRTQELRRAMEVISEQKDGIKAQAKRKQQHFLDLSHELRTPLTLVLTPLYMKAPIIDETRSLMKRNADRLMTLVNQMLKLEQLDVFGEDINHTEVSLSNRCKLLLEQFTLKANERHLQLTSEFPQVDIYVPGSESEIDTLLINLMSNAIKFTPLSGHIHLSLQEYSDKECRVSIQDSGPGIPVRERKNIFKRFVRLNQEVVESNGLGLSIVSRIIKRHKASVQVRESHLGGANFEVTLPVSRYIETVASVESIPSSRRIVLAIDDNADVLLLIKSILSPQYQVICSQAPLDGLKIAKRRIPDLIVVDVGMPDLNGFDLVVQLREHRDTKNIPVIFATARSHPRDQVTAIDSGGDVFLTKPFMPEQLLTYVNRLMQTKNVSNTIEDEIEKQTSLLTRAKKIINSAISNAEFGVDELAQELAMSRSAMYRKFKEEADILPAEFLKRCRLEHASELLKNTQLSVSKIASLTGYNQVSTFSRSFKKYFGHSPKESR